MTPRWRITRIYKVGQNETPCETRLNTSHEHRAHATYDSHETFFSHVVLAVAEPIRLRPKSSDVHMCSQAGRAWGAPMKAPAAPARMLIRRALTFWSVRSLSSNGLWTFGTRLKECIPKGQASMRKDDKLANPRLWNCVVGALGENKGSVNATSHVHLFHHNTHIKGTMSTTDGTHQVVHVPQLRNQSTSGNEQTQLVRFCQYPK